MPAVQNRGVEIIKLRKLSAAASAGKAAVDQMRDWVFGSQEWQSLALYNHSSNNSYKQIPSDIVISLPTLTSHGTKVEVINDLSLDDSVSSSMIKKTVEEILSDRRYIEHLL